MIDLKYVLANSTDMKQCKECAAVWFLFNHDAVQGIYRLAPEAPVDCSKCSVIDTLIEADCILTIEQWMEIDENSL